MVSNAVPVIGSLVTVLAFVAVLFAAWNAGGRADAADLGAHLGVQSEVVGNDLRCAFHHWSFNGAGAVTDIPYTDVVPPQAKRGSNATARGQ